MSDRQPKFADSGSLASSSCRLIVPDDLNRPSADWCANEPTIAYAELRTPKLTAKLVDLLIRETELQMELELATDPAQRTKLTAQIADVKQQRFALYSDKEYQE